MLIVKNKLAALRQLGRINENHARLVLALGSLVMFVLAAGAPGSYGH
jgi:hypothetical protein